MHDLADLREKDWPELEPQPPPEDYPLWVEQVDQVCSADAKIDGRLVQGGAGLLVGPGGIDETISPLLRIRVEQGDGGGVGPVPLLEQRLGADISLDATGPAAPAALAACHDAGVPPLARTTGSTSVEGAVGKDGGPDARAPQGDDRVVGPAAGTKPHLGLPEGLGSIVGEHRDAGPLAYHLLQRHVAPTNIGSVDARAARVLGDDARHRQAHAEELEPFGGHLGLQLFDGYDDLIDNNDSFVVLGVQRHVRGPDNPHPHVECFDANARLADLHADHGAESRVHFEQDARPAPVGLFQAHLGDEVLFQQRRGHIGHTAAAQPG